MFLGQKGTKTIHGIVTIVFQDQTFKFESWKGSSVLAIKKAVKEKYYQQKVKLNYGTFWITLNWRAH